MLRIIQKRKIYFAVSGILMIASIILLSTWGLRLGIDFTGGTLMEVEYKGDVPSNQAVQEILDKMELGAVNVQSFGERGMVFRFQEIGEEKHQEILGALEEKFGSGKARKGTSENIEVEGEGAEVISFKAETFTENEVLENRFESIGPAIGQELKTKSIYAIIAVVICIILYIAWAFRKVSKPVASWKYGITAIIALVHDILIVCGIFVVLGYFLNYEVNTPFVAALLTILGYSVNDTIVIFDRVRENLPRSEQNFEETINHSVNQTIRRSINTSVTTLLVLLAIYFFGGVTIKSFILALAIGVVSGTYSSLFVASPVLVVWQKLSQRK